MIDLSNKFAKRHLERMLAVNFTWAFAGYLNLGWHQATSPIANYIALFSCNLLITAPYLQRDYTAAYSAMCARCRLLATSGTGSQFHRSADQVR